MLAFPQLSTGSSGQFPITRARQRRTVFNELQDGSSVRFDDEFNQVAWELDYQELSISERAALESLFVASEGRLRTFTFLDPADNLLEFSEDLANTAWINGPLLTITAGVTDPLATQRASHIVNTGQAAQGLAQTLGVPGAFTYCISAWMKGSGNATLSAHAGSQTLSKTFALDSAWKRLSWTANLQQPDDAVTFQFALSAGAAVDVFGLQVEGQPGASGYKKTGPQGGVYANARFASDELKIVAEGPGRDRARVLIVALARS